LPARDTDKSPTYARNIPPITSIAPSCIPEVLGDSAAYQPSLFMKRWLGGTWAVLQKDLRIELRSRYTLNALLIFVLSTLLVAVLAAEADEASTRVQSGILWLVILFAASLGLDRAFVAEQDRNTMLLLRINAAGSMVYSGKLIYSFLTILSINGFLVVAFFLLLNVVVVHIGLLLVALTLGTLGLVGATTLLAALIARAARSGPLLPVLLFPLLLPHLLAAVDVTYLSLVGSGSSTWSVAANSLIAMIGFSGVTITASVLLFDYVWVD